jgi:elongation factor P hydroxylase
VPFLRTTAKLPCGYAQAARAFDADQLDTVHRAMDPFHSSVRVTLNTTKAQLIEKRTKPILWLPPRLLTAGCVERANGTTLIRGFVSVSLDSEGNTLVPARAHVHAYQDFVGWFEPCGRACTHVTLITYAQLGPDVPNWLFTIISGRTGLWSMQALQKYLKRTQCGDL